MCASHVGADSISASVGTPEGSEKMDGSRVRDAGPSTGEEMAVSIAGGDDADDRMGVE